MYICIYVYMYYIKNPQSAVTSVWYLESQPGVHGGD